MKAIYVQIPVSRCAGDKNLLLNDIVSALEKTNDYEIHYDGMTLTIKKKEPLNIEPVVIPDGVKIE